MASLSKEEEESGDLRQDLLKEKEKHKNWKGQEFIHYDAARSIVTQNRVLAWSRQHPFCRNHQAACPNIPHLISQIIQDKILLFVVLVLSQLEYLFEELEASITERHMLFDTEAFDKICKSTGLSERNRQAVFNGRLEVGCVFSNSDIQYLPRDTRLPFFHRRNVGKRGTSGEIFQVDILGQHLPSRSGGIVGFAMLDFLRDTLMMGTDHNC